MRIHLDEIPATGLTMSLEDLPEAVCSAFVSLEQGGVDFISPLKVRMQFKKLGDKVIMAGHLDTRVRLQCSRCLERVDQPVVADFRVVYMSQYPERLAQPAKGDVVFRRYVQHRGFPAAGERASQRQT